MSQLSVVAKRVNGVIVGYMIGWPPAYNRWLRLDKKRKEEDKKFPMFRNFRHAVYFDTKEEALAFRDSIEAKRKIDSLEIEFELID